MLCVRVSAPLAILNRTHANFQCLFCLVLFIHTQREREKDKERYTIYIYRERERTKHEKNAHGTARRCSYKCAATRFIIWSHKLPLIYIDNTHTHQHTNAHNAQFTLARIHTTHNCVKSTHCSERAVLPFVCKYSLFRFCINEQMIIDNLQHHQYQLHIRLRYVIWWFHAHWLPMK